VTASVEVAEESQGHADGMAGPAVLGGVRRDLDQDGPFAVEPFLR
jgi:hypothetical protein